TLIDLPTYPFEGQSFWLDAGSPQGDVGAAGLIPAEHPLLGAAIGLATGGGQVFTGRLSTRSHPWLAEHAVLGTTLVPGTALLELVLAASGGGQVRELTFETPLVLPAHEEVLVQVVLGEEDDGRRAVSVHSSADGQSWIRHADGVLDQDEPDRPEPLLDWPPADSSTVDISGLYERLDAQGYQYGEQFRGLTAVWQRGETLFAEAEVPEQRGFVLAPALLDAALHALLVAGDSVRLPFAWQGFRVHGTATRAVRIRLTRQDSGDFAVVVADENGLPVATARSLALREVDPARFARASDALFTVAWERVDPRPGQQAETELCWAEQADTPAATTAGVLGVLQERLPQEGPVLVVAVEAAHRGGVRGLVRSAVAEHPGRFALLDTDGSVDPAEVLPLFAAETEIRVREGEITVPRLVPATAGAALLWRRGALVITGGLTGLGALVARHAVSSWGVGELVLLGRRGMATPGAAELVAELTEAGAGVSVRACDVAEETELAEALAGFDVRGVVHAAGVLDDAVLSGLTPERVARVFEPKVSGAWNLHRLTGELDLFLLFSSVAAVLGGAGQANYAAANSCLDELAEHRRSLGLPATSLAWGLWGGGGLAAELGETELARLAARGIGVLSDQDVRTLLDQALGHTTAVTARFDRRVLRGQATAGTLPPLLHRLAPAAKSQTGSAVRGLLPTLPPAEQRAVLTTLVSTEVAAVLGHADARTLDTGKAFADLGFDSLTAIELRNRLTAATGATLPTGLIFDHPTPAALVDHLATLLGRAERVEQQVAARPVDEPIAVVGIGCRYPGGVHTPEDLWQLLAAGADAIAEFPTNRGWQLDSLYHPDPDHSGTVTVTRGGFLYQADEFDAEFFGMSPREALATDPQQRLLLETTWEALEHGGIVPESLRGSRTGVFAGIMYNDYASRLHPMPPAFEGYVTTGSAPSVASGRIAYTFGFEGPAITVDTACSSSLVAIHLAGQALRQGECDLAVAGGATVMASPTTFIEFSRQRGLAADGRCKAFGDEADGTGWGEGAGVLVLERLSDAQRNGHQILAIIRGSAVNQDGASNGLTAPNGPAQQRVIRQALANAGLTPGEVDAVEAHGTGTRLGDPIEAQALHEVYGPEHQDSPLWLGSLKSNLGHTQAAAGVGGVIKMIMAMRHGQLPATLHAQTPSSHVDWDGSIALLTESRPWEVDRPRRAGVSSFGISGTNTHLILEQAPEAEPIPAGTPGPLLFSAKTEAALRAQVEQVRELLAAGADPAAVSRALATTRTAFEHRAAGLDGAAQVAVPPTVAMMFSGQGSQWAGMGADLLTYPVFAETFTRLCDKFGLDLPLSDAVHDTANTQPALFALEVALYRLLESLGITPSVLIGHSLGEITAAHVAGVLSEDDAVTLVAARARLMQSITTPGAMLAIQAPEAEVSPLLPPGVSIAAVNTPTSVVVSGDADAVEALRDCGFRTTRLKVSHAFHSAHLDPILDEFAAVAAGLTYHEPKIPVVTNLTGEIATTLTDPQHWVRHVRGTVRFADGLATLAARGVTHLVEVGPHPAL
ncbi:type I polyketide synthase, partial [Crossiella sp. SN42]|uniref:type I polyketide synthase n=1 Tax=Crossiella sp. SN42 TaxID=2944808 RepID=UPI00207C371C